MAGAIGRCAGTRRAALWLVAVAAYAAAPVAPARGDDSAAPKRRPHPDERDRTCATMGCHPSKLDGKVVHPPAKDDCTTCHTKDGDRYVLTEPTVGAVCATCHDDLGEAKRPHAPFVEGRCTACHDPHAGPHPRLLKQPNDQRLCYGCHDAKQTPGAQAPSQHGPFAAGACTACHGPHGGAEGALLRAPERDVCLGCHDALGEAMAAAPHRHAPVEEGCTACHHPHGNEARLFLLEGGVPGLCLDCHDDIAAKVAVGAGARHGALDGEASCLGCHDPHAAQHARQLRRDPKGLCLGCHDNGLGKLAAMGPLLRDNPDHHGPIREGDCSGCHDPHGSKSFRLLVRDYPKAFYAPFDLAAFDLCFGCHEPERVLAQETTTVTGFRDGSQNLHFVHVNRQKKGRTCRACHEVHASKAPFHIREAVPFGSWELPIRFERRADGGSCAPGCHTPKTYSRGAPPLAPAPRAPAATGPGKAGAAKPGSGAPKASGKPGAAGSAP